MLQAVGTANAEARRGSRACAPRGFGSSDCSRPMGRGQTVSELTFFTLKVRGYSYACGHSGPAGNIGSWQGWRWGLEGPGSLSCSVEGSPSVRGWGRKCPTLPFEAGK